MKSQSYQSSKIWRPDLAGLKQELNALIQGQPEIIERLAQTIQRRETDSAPQRGCRDRFFFAGPTGTGKTFTATEVTKLVFGHGHFHKLDCSEYKTIEAFQSFLGNRNGDPGRLAEIYARVPVGTWLFDEVEKAHKEMVDLFLQMVWDGKVTTAAGQTLDLSGIYIFVTSNLGSAQIIGRQHVPFASLEKRVTREVEKFLRPEIINRFGPPYVFRPLDRAAQAQITLGKLEQLIGWHKQKGRNITCDNGVLDFLIRRGFSLRYGARPLLDVAEQFIGNAVAQDLLSGGTGSGRLVVSHDKLILRP